MRVPRSWNGIPAVRHARVVRLADRFATLPRPMIANDRLLPHGNGRSYGDVCLNADQTLLLTRGLDRFIQFDLAQGTIRCEAGMLLSELLALTVPQGWFLPVTPGTQYVTVGGAIANDVHGKNHHRVGSFGCHVRALELLRSDGTRIECGAQQNTEWFAATVGGLGLTGLITWAELQLLPIANPFLWTRAWRFGDLSEFWARNDEAERQYPHTVAWVDCLAKGRHLGRGIYFAGHHAPAQTELPVFQARRLRIGFELPFSLVNGPSLAAFNFVYYHRPIHSRAVLTHYLPFFYPLDWVEQWNRIYGRKGFYQYQCVLPKAVGREALKELLGEIGRDGQGSFLAVLKTFGKIRSPGLLSFPREGVTLALDFPNRNAATHRLFERLDRVVMEAGGALYPAKDARMPPELFRRGFPAWQEFQRYRDPGFSSNFWRRVTES
jgi:FAD/FMN-containing dehydrogenase